MNKVGLIGLGKMGQLYAGHLLKAFGKIEVYDIDAKRCTPFVKLGARRCDSARELAQRSSIILLALPSPSATEEAILGHDGLLAGAKRETIVVDVSTVGPETSKRMYEITRKKGVSYLDAPVSGGAPGGAGTDGARKATLTFMIGGDKKAFKKCLPTLKALGKTFYYLGPSGTGSTVKLLSNLVSGIANLVIAEAFLIGTAAGISPNVLFKVFDQTDADSYLLKEYMLPRFLNKNYEPGFKVDLQYKDHRLAGELAQRLGVPALFNDLALEVYQMLRASGFGQKDFTSAVRFWERLTGLDYYKLAKKR